MNRRAFLKSLTVGSAPAPLLLALPGAPLPTLRPLPIKVPPTGQAFGLAQLVAREALVMLKQNLLVGNLVNRSYSAEVFARDRGWRAGDMINIPILPILYHSNVYDGPRPSPRVAN